MEIRGSKIRETASIEARRESGLPRFGDTPCRFDDRHPAGGEQVHGSGALRRFQVFAVSGGTRVAIVPRMRLAPVDTSHVSIEILFWISAAPRSSRAERSATRSSLNVSAAYQNLHHGFSPCSRRKRFHGLGLPGTTLARVGARKVFCKGCHGKCICRAS